MLRGAFCAKLKSRMLNGQVLGRNLEALATRAQELKEQWRDQFVSVEHLVLALVDDARFGKRTLEAEGLTKAKLENAIKEMRGNNRVTDQVRLLLSWGSCHTTARPVHMAWLGSLELRTFTRPALDRLHIWFCL